MVAPRFNSVSDHFRLYCYRSWYKSLMFNITDFVSPLFTTLFLIYADKVGRTMILLLIGPIGMIGACIGLMSNDMGFLTLSMTIMNVFYGTIFSLNFLYFNEIIIDPWRSKASGVQTFSVTFGSLSKFLSFFNLKSIYNFVCHCKGL